VALCAPNWKAKHVLNNTLLAAHDSIANDSSDKSQSDNAPSHSCSNKKKKEKDKWKKMKKKKDPCPHCHSLFSILHLLFVVECHLIVITWSETAEEKKLLVS
jgi:hypothetical protein